MKKSSFVTLAALAVLAVLAAACGSGSATMKANVPDNPSKRYPSVGKTVLVKVSDDREFQPQPVPLSVHSYAGEKPLAGRLARVIGAKSGVGGKDFENLLLDETQTVKSLVLNQARVAFEYAGFDAVTTAEDAGGAPDFTADVSVAKFWVWMTPGTMTISVTADIEAEIAVTSAEGSWTMSARGFHEDPDVSKSPESYRFALNEALHVFLQQLQEECMGFVSESAGEEEKEEAGDGFE
jgi:uncharacterized lipoprotein YajG